MRFLVVTNRNIVSPRLTDERLFGENTNTKGPAEIRFAWASRVNDGWLVELVPEPRRVNDGNAPSRDVFREFRRLVIDGQKDCVFYIHGYNKPFAESLEQAHEIQERYDVAVVVFSWPANPGGFILFEYRKAQAIARDSVNALDRVFEKLGSYFREEIDENCGCSFNLIVHSLGNYLFEQFIRAPVFTGETRFFDNIVLNQADVNHSTHIEWVDKLRFSRRVYITVNERDSVLDASDIINTDRLGNTARNLNAERPTYIDFTDGSDVGKKHRLFENLARANGDAMAFFNKTLHGQRALPSEGFEFDDNLNAFKFQ